MARKTIAAPATLRDKVAALATLQGALRAETQRAELGEALARTRLGDALLEALAARAEAEQATTRLAQVTAIWAVGGRSAAAAAATAGQSMHQMASTRAVMPGPGLSPGSGRRLEPCGYAQNRTPR